MGGLEVARTIVREKPKLEEKPEFISYELVDTESAELSKLKELMWKYVGIEICEEGLKKALVLKEELELPDQIKELAKAIDMCALERRESRGVHYRTDYPLIDKAYNK